MGVDGCLMFRATRRPVPSGDLVEVKALVRSGLAERTMTLMELLVG
jgi:hypothetical protein